MQKIIFILLVYLNFCFSQLVVKEIGRFGGTGSKSGLFKNPTAIDISSDGRIYICDHYNHRIQVFDRQGYFIEEYGGFGSGKEQFNEPMDIWARSTLNIYVADYNNHRVQRFDRKMNYISSLYSNPGDDERFQFREVVSVAYSPQGELFVLERGQNKIIKFRRESGETAFGYYESGPGELTEPIQIDITKDHRILVSDAVNMCVNIYDYFGNFLKKLEDPVMQEPKGLAVDNEKHIYVCDPKVKAIFIFENDGSLLSVIDNIGGIQLTRPVDLCAWKDKNNTNYLYIIEGDQVLIVRLQ